VNRTWLVHGGVVGLLLGALLSGCGSDAEPGSAPPPTASTASRAAGVRLDLKAATGTPVVRFTGRVNDGTPLSVDLASLNALPAQDLTVFEPFVKKSMTFTGVRFADLLDAAHATGTSVTIHALDDYEATLTSSVLRTQGALLATGVDGKAIGLDAGGPVRLVFPASSTTGKDTDLWVWSIDKITVE